MPTSDPSDFAALCRTYLEDVRKLRANPSASPELSLRTPLNVFLDGAALHLGRDARFINEGSGAPKGRPDFVLSRDGETLGYVEAEKPDADLTHLTGHAKTQNDGFKNNLDNFLLTNHLDFRLYDRAVEVERAQLFDAGTGAVSVSSEEAAKLEALLDRLTKAEPPAIASPRDLAFFLARRARTMRDAVRDLFRDANDAPGGELQDAFDAFRTVLLPDLKPYLSDEERRNPKRPHAFDDIYAQTLAYGLFAARFAHATGAFTPQSAARYLAANPFLRQLFARFMSDLPQEIAWIADDMARVLAPPAAVEVVMQGFAKHDGADPLIHFYEPFLNQYDAALRDARGVYYTPPAVVSYITRSVHRLLQTRFDCPDGLATRDYLPPIEGQAQQHRVQILDPATGTGSFLFGVIETIHQHVEKIGGWASYAEEHLRPRLFGFELIVAPYVVAHLKLGLLLDSYGAKPSPHAGRWQVYLTNTLEPSGKHPVLPGSRYITEEVESANEVKSERPILVVLGNPPYKGHSSNILKEGSAVQKRHRSYYLVDGQGLGERNPKWLQDDYIKFWAFAHERIAQTGEGVAAFITNHGFLDNPTFRGFRRALMETFDDLYLLDLHGSTLKGERAPDGSRDDNVFDIQPGVCILLAVRNRREPDAEVLMARVHHAHLWGPRENKYTALRDTDVTTTQWTPLQPESPAYLFIPIDDTLKEEYERGVDVNEIMPVNIIGIFTGQDERAVGFTTQEVELKATELHELPSTVVREISYRPFDKRAVVYDPKVVQRPRLKIMHHMLAGANTGLCIGRSGAAVGSDEWNVVTAVDAIPDLNIFRRGGGQLFPLYLYPSEMEKQMGEERRPNFAKEFLQQLSQSIGREAGGLHGLPQSVSAEEVFAYLYAVLHAPTYRTRYAPFLRLDFPRVPLPRDAQQFERLAQLGAQLVALHTLDAQSAPVLGQPRHKFIEGESNVVVKARVAHNANERRVAINAHAYFEDVDSATWSFRVGGYTPAEKWLKDRDGRALSYDDQAHYRRLLIAQSETLLLLPDVDEALGFGAGIGEPTE